jgi:GNAT superfamily N-acetyltransferase
MVGNINIRPIVPADIPQLMGLDHSAASDHVWQLELRREPRGQQISAVLREVRLPREVALVYPNDPFALADDWMSRAAIFVAVSGQAPIGYACLTEPRPSTGWVTDLVVAPRWRRQGVGSALLSSAHAWSSEKNHRRIFIEMQSKNHAAIRLAQKNAYEFCGYNDHYYSTQDVALFFVRAP